MSQSKCVYNKSWQDKYIWVKPFKGDKRKALCSPCSKLIDISSMGESALKSHAKGEKHSKLTRPSSGTGCIPISTFVIAKSEPETESATNVEHGHLVIPPAPPIATCSNSHTVRQAKSPFVIGDAVTRAEIMWTLKLISDHQSFRSSENVAKLFKTMFPDSEIAQQFTCGERKAAYLSVFGLAEYFSKQLRTSITGPYVVLFDESLNHKMQEKQMDIHIRFWNSTIQQVETRYFTSDTLGHATADDMMKHFNTNVLESGLPVKNMIQIGMDGPSVNWKFHTDLKQKLLTDYDTTILNLGSCGLHTVHNAFKAGAEATGWQISSFLSSLYYLFKDSPARREDFIKITNSKLLPLKFVNHRWLENVSVCERALLLMEKIKAYVKAVDGKKVNKPTCKSYGVVSQLCKNDSLLVVKLHFFKCMALHLQPFLAKYQTSRPMIPFLSDDLCNVIKGLLRKVFKTDGIQSDEQLVKINIDNKDLHINIKNIDLGFASTNELKNCKNVSEKQVLEFRMACKDFIIQILKKVLLKSPVLYSVVRQMSCLNPLKMVANADECVEKFRKLLTLLLNAKRVTENECELVMQQYIAFIGNISVFGSDRFSSFNSNTDRLDTLFTELIGHNEDYCLLYKVIKLSLCFSHGQATVERGFSFNKEIEVENMSLKTLKSQRIICDHIQSIGGLDNVIITKELLVSAKLSRQKYERYLESERERKKSEQEVNKRKSVLDEVDTLKKKRIRLETDISVLEKSSDELYEKAESTGQISFVTRANSLKRTMKDKSSELSSVKLLINEKLEQLKK